MRHYVSSKVMSWVALERAIRIAEQTGHAYDTTEWQSVMESLHAEVMERGWSEPLQFFRQCYETDTVDASVLLIPVMGFLPSDHPRVRSTLEIIEGSLTIEGFVYRFLPSETLGPGSLPFSEYEGHS